MVFYSIRQCLSITNLLAIICLLDFTQQEGSNEQDESNSIRLSYAATDFERLIKEEDYSGVYEKMITTLKKIIQSWPDEVYSLIKPLGIFRKYCILKDSKYYNRLMYDLKGILRNQNNYKAWNTIVEEKFGLITVEESLPGYSNATKEDGEKFLQSLFETDLTRDRSSTSRIESSSTDKQVESTSEQKDSVNITYIGTSNPAHDFMYLLDHGTPLDKLFSNMTEVIEKLLQHKPDDIEKPLKSLKTLRFVSLEKHSHQYNRWMYKLKKILQEQSNVKFWNAIVKENLGLTMSGGKTTQEELQEFIKPFKSKK